MITIDQEADRFHDHAGWRWTPVPSCVISGPFRLSITLLTAPS
jgi:hypothetical protein